MPDQNDHISASDKVKRFNRSSLKSTELTFSRGINNIQTDLFLRMKKSRFRKRVFREIRMSYIVQPVNSDASDDTCTKTPK